MRRYFSRLHKVFSSLSRNSVLLVVLTMIVFLGYLDYVTGVEISFSFFYLIPISITAWYVGVKAGTVIVGISIIAWGVSNQLAGQTYSNGMTLYFNGLVRILVFLMIAMLLNELKLALRHEQKLSQTDYLTGALAKREFYARAELEIHRAHRYLLPLTLAFIDLDSFKLVNDSYGHAEGDNQLKSISDAAASVIRKNDIFARVGGDEFALLLPETDRQNAMFVVQKVKDCMMSNLQRRNSPVTLSIGVITFANAPLSVNEMLEHADALMYQAKKQGKNQVLYIQV